MRLDEKPQHWEDRIVLFAGHLTHKNRKSTTVKSYISAIKAVLTNHDIEINEDQCLLGSLTRACRINRDKLTIRLPIQKQLLNTLLKKTHEYFMNRGQVYLATLYKVLFATAYYGLFRIGELTESEHCVKVCDVQVATNKEKMLFILRSSKTHCRADLPQMITITKLQTNNKSTLNQIYCPYKLLCNYSTSR